MKTLGEKIHERHAKAGHICEYVYPDGRRCNKRSVQIAHRIPKGKTGRRAVQILWADLYKEKLNMFGERMDSIIHHDINTRATCIDHNSYVLINISNRVKMMEILGCIYEANNEH